MSRDFYIPYGENEEHAARLKHGLALMHPQFSAYVCTVCDGKGEYPQTYTLGCGGGYYTSTGQCDYCAGTGLCQGTGHYNPAPESVREQVLNAAQAQLTHDGEPAEACIICRGDDVVVAESADKRDPWGLASDNGHVFLDRAAAARFLEDYPEFKHGSEIVSIGPASSLHNKDDN